MKRSPGTAFWLSIIPGAGYVYLGQALKGFALILLVVSAIHVADRGGGPFGLVALFLWVFGMIDAHRTAVEMNHLEETGQALPRNSQSFRFGKWWGWGLIALGVFLTLDNMGWLDLDWIVDLWPLALIAMGVYLLRRPESPAPQTEPPPTAPPLATASAETPNEDPADDLAMKLDPDSEAGSSNA